MKFDDWLNRLTLRDSWIGIQVNKELRQNFMYILSGELVKFAEDQEKVINDMGEEKSWADIRLAVELQVYINYCY